MLHVRNGPFIRSESVVEFRLSYPSLAVLFVLYGVVRERARELDLSSEIRLLLKRPFMTAYEELERKKS